MNQRIKNKIEATDKSISNLLKNQKFTIDYFQREYRWQEKHMKSLVEDLTNTFLKSYNEGDRRSDVPNYQSYYLGPVVFNTNVESNKKSIIDGQQRITSLTLILIYLNHLQKDNSQKVPISDLIFSERYGEKSFNMSDESREECLSALFETGHYFTKEGDEESTINIKERYDDIEESFPEEIDAFRLPFFIDWLIENVVIVEITAYSDDNAYTIFETMNDRGLNLTPTEMLKGYILSKITDKEKRTEINKLWKIEIQKLHEYGDITSQSFFQAWFRSKYAVTMRAGKVGSENQDFELIGSRFHSWFKDKHKELFNLNTSDDFYLYFKRQFPFFVKWYLKSRKRQEEYHADTPHLHYIYHCGIAESLQEPLLLSPIEYSDSEDIILKKMDYVARYIETFTVRRSVNYRKYGQTAIKYSMFNTIKIIRDNNLDALSHHLVAEVGKISEQFSSMQRFGLHMMNRKFIKHLLSRISSFVDNLVGKDSNYVTYREPSGKLFEIEHIWANKFEEHLDEFSQQDEFRHYRNLIGALILLPHGTNQSFNSDRYNAKVEYYIRENTYAQTLHPHYYVRNPNFLNSPIVQELGFKYHLEFRRNDIEERQALAQRICERIWSIDFYGGNNLFRD